MRGAVHIAMRFQQSCRMAVWLVIAPLLLGGCSILREFGPVVEVHTLDAGEAIELKRGDILTRGKLSDATKFKEMVQKETGAEVYVY
jgi:hypothetical protein